MSTRLAVLLPAVGVYTAVSVLVLSYVYSNSNEIYLKDRRTREVIYWGIIISSILGFVVCVIAGVESGFLYMAKNPNFNKFVSEEMLMFYFVWAIQTYIINVFPAYGNVKKEDCESGAGYLFKKSVMTYMHGLDHDDATADHPILLKNATTLQTVLIVSVVLGFLGVFQKMTLMYFDYDVSKRFKQLLETPYNLNFVVDASDIKYIETEVTKKAPGSDQNKLVKIMSDVLDKVPKEKTDAFYKNIDKLIDNAIRARK